MMPYNQCSWYFETVVLPVIKGEIQYMYAMPIKIKINGNKGFCGSTTFKNISDWEQCKQWNQDWTECKEWYFPCWDAAEIQVYNLSGIIEKYEDFAEEFYKYCGVLPDSNQKYPDIVSDYYGYIELTSQGYNCVQNYWKPLFMDLYSLNYKTVWQIKAQCWWTTIGSYKWSYITEYNKFCLENDTDSWVDCATYGNSGCETCPEGSRLITEEYKYEDQIIDFGTECYFYSPPNDQVTLEKFVSTGGHYENGYFAVSCQEQLNADAGLPEINAFIKENLAKKELYGLYNTYKIINGYMSYNYYERKGTSWNQQTCQNSNSLCVKANWQSGKHDNYYGSGTHGSWIFRMCQFYIERTDKTPEKAKGIKFKIIQKNNKWNWKPEGKIDNITENVYQIQLPFNQTYYFPLHTYPNLYNVRSKPTCNSEGWMEGEWVIDSQVNGTVGGDTLMETDDVNIIGLEYIY